MEYKITKAKELIKRALDGHEFPLVSSSFGKDSTVLMHLVMEVSGNSVPILHVNTGVEFPETLAFRDAFVAKHNLRLHEQPPFPETFWTIVDKYGFPVGQRGFDKSADGEATTKCCYYLKKKPFARFRKKYPYDLNFTGIRAMESQNRRQVQKTHGDYYFKKKDKYWACHPILDWTDKELFRFIADRGIDLSALYGNTIEGKPYFKLRTGCWSCPQGWNSGKAIWLRQYYPRFYETLMKKGFAKFILERKIVGETDNATALDVLRERPCFFETL